MSAAHAAVAAPARPYVDLAAEVGPLAGEWAEDVDRSGRFPAEAVAQLRARGLLAAAGPVELGGGCRLPDLIEVAGKLAEHCASTAMIWAMHQIQLACLADVAEEHPLRVFTRRVCQEQLLLASATSEAGIGGDIRRSGAALEPEGGLLRVRKDATVVSYAEHADAVLTTLRRHPEAAPGDQVLVVVRTEQARLAALSGWDALGMRGTCSGGHHIDALVEEGAVLPRPFGEIAALIMVPYSHLLWSSCWMGIAAGALRRARAFLRAQERKAPGGAPLAGARLAEATGRLQITRSAIAEAARALDGDTELRERWSTVVALNELKCTASQGAVDIALTALSICGFPGYLESGPHSVARHVRDALSAPLMIANDRLLATNASLLVGHKSDERPW